MTDALDAVRGALRDERAWLVGGAVRDRLLGREVDDFDLVVDGEVRAAARHLALEIGGPAFELSDRFGAWRVVGPGRGWHADLTPLRHSTIEGDLAERDFTVNAIAEPLLGGALIDPYGGAADVDERRLRMVRPRAFEADPLRSLRLARLACELGLEAEPETLAAARASGPRVAGVAQERVFAELRAIVTSDGALRGLRLMDEVDVTAAVLPELDTLRGVEQTRYHHLDVHGHTLEVLEAVIDIERDPEPAVGSEHAAAVAGLLAEPLADELTRGGALRFGALLHDAAKPATRIVTEEGRVGFPGHDATGAVMARDTLARLRTSERLRVHVAALTRHHLRLGFLVHRRPLTRTDVYRYLTTCEPVEADVTLLSIADRLATRGHKAQESIAGHMDLARAMLGDALAWRAQGARRALVRGDELADALGIAPGPQLGPLLEAIAEARFSGEVSSRDEAIALARRALEREG